MPFRTVKIVHPELGESEVLESALPVWLARGWAVAADPPATPLHPAAAPPAADEQPEKIENKRRAAR